MSDATDTIEMLDIYDDNLNHLGSKPRPDVHRDGDWHRVFHVWVIYRDDNGDDWLIVQMRGADKDTFPNHLDVSAAGHYASGETVADGVRELHEELGLTPNFIELIPIGKRVSMAKYDDLIDREVADVFFYICDQPLSEYTYQEDELAGLIAINIEDGIQLFTNAVDSIRVPAIGFDENEITIQRHEFVPTLDDYHLKVMLLAQRCLNGEQYLRI